MNESPNCELVVELPIADSPVTATISLGRVTEISFNYFRMPYRFTITKWGGQGFATLVRLFFQHCPRDPLIYGLYTTESHGYITSPAPSSSQRNNILFQAAVDVMICLSKIVAAHQRAVLDYAVWYREEYAKKEFDSYSTYITRIACHCIVHESFMSGTVRYDVVEF